MYELSYLLLCLNISFCFHRQMLAGCFGTCPALLQPLPAQCLQAGKGRRNELLEWFCPCGAQPPLAHKHYLRPGVLPVRWGYHFLMHREVLHGSRLGIPLTSVLSCQSPLWQPVWKSSLYVHLLHPPLIYVFGHEVCCHLMLEHTNWKEPQLWFCVYKQFYSVPFLGQYAFWKCWSEKWLA